MTDIIITGLVVPKTANAPDAAEFRAMVDIGNAMARADVGTADLDDTVESLLPAWHDQSDRLSRGFVARRDGEIVGAAVLQTNTAAGTTRAEVEFSVMPEEMATTGQTLLSRAEAEARELGRSVLQSWTLHPASPGDAPITPATGWGLVASTPMSELLVANGFTFEQVERTSILPLDQPMDAVHRRLDEAIAYAGDEYRLVEWSLPTPPELRRGYGGVIARMATDVPVGDLVSEAEVWDDEKVARRDARILSGGATFSVAAVEHVPTGEIVAFNELKADGDLTGVTHQWGTLVVPEHRGRRLGTVVKCANLLRWQGIAPRSPKVVTFNAEENRAMLDINEAMGFVPASYAGGWQKRLT
ncbi:GNAT family protein [uncultured Microbacterium sp.]|uniref:GNAT family N-acetyltransferase n=1 Tax=uncultured Microbacterium sp. TaxID=191216 RepID=UPI00261727F8|nr:GNAT family N-acetyltransferase [uncultured Microbacterium sp.]